MLAPGPAMTSFDDWMQFIGPRKPRKLPIQQRMRVLQAIEIIGPGARKAKVELEVVSCSNFVERLKNLKKSGTNVRRLNTGVVRQKTGGHLGVMTKQQKKAAGNLAKALYHLEMALNNPDLVSNLVLDFPMDKDDFETWWKRAKAAATTKLPYTGRLNLAKQHAVEAAASLLKAHGLPISGTRKGQFCRLAAVLYGNSRINLYHYCCAYLEKAGTGR
jgi:hypothetical protein